MPRLSPIRRDSRLRRRAGNRPPRSITLIVCEGETELEYLKVLCNHLGLRPTEVILAENTEGSAPISVVTCAERRAEKWGGYDHIFCVFDRDSHESFERARSRIRQLASRRSAPLPIREIVSVPCFEIWVLLHFEQSDAQFADCSEVISRIRDQHMSDYVKAKIRVANALVDRLDVALASAAWLELRAEENNWNPYTAVHLLVEHLRTVAAQEG
ncbi:MAG: RloB family protein [Burkholderiales bacterium]